MHNSSFVGSGQGASYLTGNLERFAQLHARMVQALAQCLSIDKLRRDEVLTVYLTDLIDGENVRVIQAGGGASLLLKAADASFIAGKVVRQQLERDLAAKRFIAGQIDLAHSARAQQLDNLIVADRAAHHRTLLVISNQACGYFVNGRFNEISRLFVRA